MNSQSQDMNLREALGLALLVIAVALVPMGWYVSRMLWFLSLIGIIVGVGLFYTERRLKREAQIEKESAGGDKGCGPVVPTDIHNYTGWRFGGRSETMDDSFGSGGGGEAD